MEMIRRDFSHLHQKWQWLRSWHSTIDSCTAFKLPVHCFGSAKLHWQSTKLQAARMLRFRVHYVYTMCLFICLHISMDFSFRKICGKNSDSATVFIRCNIHGLQKCVATPLPEVCRHTSLMLEKRFVEYSCRICFPRRSFFLFFSFGSYAPARYGCCISQIERQFSSSIWCNLFEWWE